MSIDVDSLAQEIRRVDGNHDKGAGALAEALLPFLSAALSAGQAQPVDETLQSYFERQINWSRETFGPALRTKGVIDHIRKELREIEQNPHDLSEWIDVTILAMDGFWRHGGKAEDLLPALLAKQEKNMARVWPDWRTRSEDQAIEHDRSHDASALSTQAVDVKGYQVPVKWESPEEWAIEQRAFHAAGRDDVPVDVQQLVAKLWAMYCHAAAPSASIEGETP